MYMTLHSTTPIQTNVSPMDCHRCFMEKIWMIMFDNWISYSRCDSIVRQCRIHIFSDGCHINQHPTFRMKESHTQYPLTWAIVQECLQSCIRRHTRNIEKLVLAEVTAWIDGYVACASNLILTSNAIFLYENYTVDLYLDSSMFLTV